MADLELCYMSASEALRRFKERSLSPVELLSALIERADEVVVVVPERNFRRLTHRLEPGKVDHRGVRARTDHAIGLGRVAEIDLFEDDRFTREFLDPRQRFARAVAQIVQHHDVIAGIQQLHAAMTADVTRPARDQYRFTHFEDLPNISR